MVALCALGVPLLAASVPLRIAVAPQPAGDALTLEAALARVASLAAGSWPADGIVVQLAAGTYRLERPLQLTARHSGRTGAPLIFEGPRGGAAVFSGGRPLDGFAPLAAGDAPLLPAAARPHVRQAALDAGIDPGRLSRQGQGLDILPAPLELIYRGLPMPLAAWPDQGSVPIAALGPGNDPGTIVLDRGHFDAWSKEADLWMHGYWGQDWADEWIGVAGLQVDARSLRLRGGPPRYGARPGQRVRIVNALSELDSPGEWYLDRAAKRLYFWPPGPLGAGDAEVTVLDTLVALQGTSHVRFDGIDFENVRGDALVVQGGSDVRISHARIRNAGNRAVQMGGVDHAVIDCDIRDTGQGGIVLWGGDRRTLQPARLLAQGNRIQRFERQVRTYRAAIMLGGVGNVARGNLIFDGAHTGLLFYGNDHLVELNDFHALARETGDVGVIYTGKDWTARGTVVRNNFLHDVHAPGRHGSHGVYLDDQASGTTVVGNLFLRVDQPVFIGGGRDNLVDNNLFVASGPALRLDARGRTWQKKETDDPDGTLRRHLRDVPYRDEAYATRYPGLADLLQRSPGEPLGNVARRNAVLEGSAADLLEGTAQLLEQDRWFDRAQLLLRSGVDPAHASQPGELALLPDSTALRDGFAPLPLEAMNCTSARWTAAGDEPRQLAACSAPPWPRPP